MCCCFNPAVAQHRSSRALTYGGGGNGATNFSDGWAVSVGTGVDVPQGDLNSIFKPAININTGVYRFLGPFTANFNVGYRSFRPDEAIVTQEAGSTIYADMSAFSIHGGLAYNIDLTDDFRVYGGVNLGAYITQFGVAFIYDDPSYAYVFQKWKTSLYYAPKVGMSFPVTNHLGFNIESKYNFFSQKVDFEEGNGSAKLNWNSFTLGAELVLKF